MGTPPQMGSVPLEGVDPVRHFRSEDAAGGRADPDGGPGGHAGSRGGWQHWRVAPGRTQAASAGLRIINLGTLGGNFSSAHGINDHGRVVGGSLTRSGAEHAILWSHGKMRDLGTLGGNFSEAAAINDHGQIVGSSETRSGAFHAFLWYRGKMRDLGTLGGRDSYTVGINDHGKVVGPRRATRCVLASIRPQASQHLRVTFPGDQRLDHAPDRQCVELAGHCRASATAR
jgi:probable HAF family extracellular repeat protein